MCGINGFSWEDKAMVQKMNQIISYRGPDDKGVYVDSGISLGHNRLSIVDLSRNGHQPMSNSEGDLWIVFNGEIYNFKEIRKTLIDNGYKFNSATDTEVILHAYSEWGEKCLSMFNGMFAFAIWDANKKEIFIARDRLGIKPVYYYLNKGKLIFSSEIKSILIHGIERKINLQGLNQYLAYRFIPNDQTILQGIRKLLPGHYMRFNLKQGEATIRKYWEISWNKSNHSEEYYLKKLKELLVDSVNKRLMSDVPLGTFLSGGVDSSLITAINSRLREDKVKSYIVGFGDSTDEFKPARTVAEHLGTDHKELQLNYANMSKNLPKIIWYMDEPNSDITMVPLYFLSKFAKRQITVVNTGEGADELFAGYPHYQVGNPAFGLIPKSARKGIYSLYYSPFKSWERTAMFGRPAKDSTLINELGARKNVLDGILNFDIKNEIPNWQLARVDRMTMAHAMEARVPFLDHRIVELSAKIPDNLKLRGKTSKYILKKIATEYLPKKIIERQKQGFTTPVHSWLKNDLEDRAEDLIINSLGNRNIINKNYLRKLVDKHKKSEAQKAFRPYSYKMLVLNNLELWFQIYLDQTLKV